MGNPEWDQPNEGEEVKFNERNDSFGLINRNEEENKVSVEMINIPEQLSLLNTTINILVEEIDFSLHKFEVYPNYPVLEVLRLIKEKKDN